MKHKSPKLNESLLDIMVSVNRLLRQKMVISSTITHLTLIQLEALLLIDRSEKIQMMEIAEYFHITKPTATILLNKLVSLGYVERLGVKADRRVVGLALTKLGNTILKDAKEIRSQKINKILSVLSVEDKEHMLRIMRTVLANIQK
ncbi:MAG: MarR family transcriptional regulator [Candidatus Roizmanbacteria bacterium]